ncbi:MAG: HAD hydrolase-like protein [Verrucomicrobiaceae bacterium]|nr:HAD hydrolase-like protein [Verrucomicrobiaceae bacterium]
MGALPHLLLFDIDGTLLNTGGAGMRAFALALEHLYPEQVAACGGVPDIDFAGSTDSGIVMGIFAKMGMEDSGAERARFYASYLDFLRLNLGEPGAGGSLLDGVAELLGKLQGNDYDNRVLSGLLTGNIAAGATMKTDHYGISGYFHFGAYGDDHHDRNQLGPVAVQRASGFWGQDLSAAPVTVIGDTVKDIRCARAFGARVVAVASGCIPVHELAAHEPDILLESLGDVDAVLSQLQLA